LIRRSHSENKNKMIKKLFKLFIKFWKGLWHVIKSMGNWKGFVSLILSWLLLSGSGLILLGILITNNRLISLGTTIYAFWLLPATPMILIEVAIAMLMQRFIFRDKNVTWKVIKTKFKEAFNDNKKESDTMSYIKREIEQMEDDVSTEVIPVYFKDEVKIGKYVSRVNEEGRHYVPQNKKDFDLFMDAIFKKIKNKTNEQKRNYDLILLYPFLLPKNRWDRGLSLDKDFGFDFTWTEMDSMPVGWRISFGKDLLNELKEALLKSNSLYDYMILDIKEKYGTLRWYDNGNTMAGDDVIRKYEQLSAETCIKCGEPSTHFTEGWIMPLCDACDNKVKK